MALPYITLATTGSSTPYLIPTWPTLLSQGWSTLKNPKWDYRKFRSVSGLEWRATDQTWPRWEWELTFTVMRDRWGVQFGLGEFLTDDHGNILLSDTGVPLTTDTAATPAPIGTHDDLRSIMGFFNLFGGGFSPFYYDDPTDNTASFQYIGTGNGVQVAFQLQRTLGKTLSGGGFSEPVWVPNTVSGVFLNGVEADPSTYSVNTAGLVTFVSPPAVGVIVSADFTFLWFVRFSSDGMNFENFMELLWQNKSIKFVSVIESPTIQPNFAEMSLDGHVTLATTISSDVIFANMPSFATTLTNDVAVVAIAINAEGSLSGTTPPSVTSVYDNVPAAATTRITMDDRVRITMDGKTRITQNNAGLTWARRPPVVHGPGAGFVLGQNYIDVEVWWAVVPSPVADFKISILASSDLGFLNAQAVAVNGADLTNPFDPSGALPRIAQNLGPALAGVPQVVGVSSSVAYGMGIAFNFGFGAESGTGCGIANSPTRAAWNGPWTWLDSTVNLNAFIGLQTSTNVVSSFFRNAPINSATFGVIDPVICPVNYYSWVVIGDVLQAAQI